MGERVIFQIIRISLAVLTSQPVGKTRANAWQQLPANTESVLKVTTWQGALKACTDLSLWQET